MIRSVLTDPCRVFLKMLTKGLWSLITDTSLGSPTIYCLNRLNAKSTANASRSNCAYRRSVGVVALLAHVTVFAFSGLFPCAKMALNPVRWAFTNK